MKPLISVVMPTYNSEATIETALKSIRMQTVADQIEILVIDGGSTDTTCDIARRYGAIVLDNPQRLPEPAKCIGIQKARGQYVVFQDSDEELRERHQLEKRLMLFSSAPEIRCVVCDRQYPGKEAGCVAPYYCRCGDPFTWFVYRTKDSILKTFVTSLSEQKTGGWVLRFAPGAPTPIGDGGTTMVDLDWVKQVFVARWQELNFVCSMAHCVIQKTGCCGCIEGDNITHHVQTDFPSYMKKLRFRIINNLFHKEGSGFSARIESAGNSRFMYRKYGFVLYALTVAGPLWDSIYLAVRNRSPAMLLHFFYVYYVCACTAVYLLGACMGKEPKLTSYGK